MFRTNSCSADSQPELREEASRSELLAISVEFLDFPFNRLILVGASVKYTYLSSPRIAKLLCTRKHRMIIAKMGSLKLKTYPFLFCIVFLRLAVAQSCWRNLTCDGPTDTAFPGIWESNIFAPKSRKVNPKQILSTETGEVMSNYSSTTYLVGNGSQVVFDFGKEVGGLVSLNYTTTGSGAIGLAFTEGKSPFLLLSRNQFIVHFI